MCRNQPLVTRAAATEAQCSETPAGAQSRTLALRLWANCHGPVCVSSSLLCWAFTTAIALTGAWFGYLLVRPDKSWGFLDSLAMVDGHNYRQIIEEGYSYADRVASSVAFFPAYPLAARWLAWMTGLGTVAAQVIVSNACCLAAFLFMGKYLQQRIGLSLRGGVCSASQEAWHATGRANDDCPGPSGTDRSREVASYALLAMGLLPTTFFFRMGYTESMFLCLAILSLYGIVRAWPLPVVALVVGLATAVRPVGVALLMPLVFYAWTTSGSKGQAVRRLAYAVPLGCWGLGAYMVFQYVRFGQPLAFALTQEYHRMRPIGTIGEKVLALITWEPIRDVYDPLSQGYWQALYYMPSRLFSLEFANPIYLIGIAALIAWGAWKRWLTVYEVLVAVSLLAIPYLTRAYEMRMLSQARFAAVVFPVYIVLGHLLARMPLVVSGALLALAGLMLGIYAALFAAGYPFL